MSADKLIANYLRIAREDLAGARQLALTKNRNAPYLAEQSAEKIILAVLTSEALHGGVRHALSEMVSLIPDANPLKSDLARLTPLAAYATSYRYPTSSRVLPAPDPTELEGLLKQLDSVLAAAALRFGVDLDVANAPARSPSALR